MFSETELKILSDISRGNDTVPRLIENTGRSRAQIYKVLNSLRKKKTLRLDEGRIILENKTHISLLINVLRRLHRSYGTISNDGMDIIAELTVGPVSVKELTERTGINQRTVSRKISKMASMSMVRKNDGKYSLNQRAWPDLYELAASYHSYLKNNDPRAIQGSKIYYVSKELVVFSSDSEADYTKTAFSRYTELGIEIGLRTNYYCDLKRDLSVPDVFLHSLHIISNNKDWWLMMMALIFYVKFRDELKGVDHKMKDEMDAVLTGSSVEGWVPINEMRERADMYGVRL
ncbi:MAG: hypothetical protein FWG58_01925 [Methanomassiliicoccaceae archaeon]|nr:hypothetical protein [Methanomassiliicoccaceae archaeon]